MIGNQYGRWERHAEKCAVPGCERPVKARGWCTRHYGQWTAHGEIHDRPRGVRARPPLERVLSHVSFGSCWVYRGAQHTNRPTVTIRRGVVTTTYRLVYEALVGSVPEGYDLHHRCGNPRCVNPEHLELLTHAEHTAFTKPRLGTGGRAASPGK